MLFDKDGSIKNVVRCLSFSNEGIDVKLLTNVENFLIKEESIVLNIGNEIACIQSDSNHYLSPKSSIILLNVILQKADSIILIQLNPKVPLDKIVNSWEPAFNILSRESNVKTTYSSNISLWSSKQDVMGVQNLDPYHFSGQRNRSIYEQSFLIRANLWFAPADTNCSIHREHGFIEIHT